MLLIHNTPSKNVCAACGGRGIADDATFPLTECPFCYGKGYTTYKITQRQFEARTLRIAYELGINNKQQHKFAD